MLILSTKIRVEFYLLLILLASLTYISTANAADISNTQSDLQSVERLANPTFYSPALGRYRGAEPIPQEPVTRDTYMQWIEESGLLELVDTPKLGLSGPQRFMPILAKYVQTHDKKWADAIMAMLRHFSAALEDEVAQKGWTEQFIQVPAYLPLYRKYLIEGGVIREDNEFFRDLWLYYCRNLHVWGTQPTEWRGACHRSIPEGLAKGLAAKLYPDIPEAEHWKRYAELVFDDFWKHREWPQNDTGYSTHATIVMLCMGDQYLGDDRLCTDPVIQRFWRRQAVEFSPDGAMNPFGPNGGWNSTAGVRIFMLERVAARTGNGEFRYVAHKAMNYIKYQGPAMRGDHYLWSIEVGENIALAWLFADDSVKPVEPYSGSLWNKRIEATRLPHTDKNIVGKYLKDLDPAPNKAHLCCAYMITGKEWPDKLILRSGWNPGDFFALVELFPVSFPANPGGIMGMNRWGAPFTQICTSKGGSKENRVMIVDIEGKANLRYHPDKDRIDENWKRGKMPDIRSAVTYFEEMPKVTFARVRVENMDGLPVLYQREFVFVKNRFLATREIVTFEESFKAKVAPLWNTQNIGPQIGRHWANTFIGAPVGSNGWVDMLTPPADLLVWFAPKPECMLQVVDRFEQDPRTEACRGQVRYLWEGTPQAGRQLVFTQVYYPHKPYRARTNTADPGAVASYGDKLQATAGASGITVLRDDAEASVLRLEFNPGQIEYVIFNPREEKINIDFIQTDKAYAYISKIEE